jgi:acyl-coenzyme A synthetase/AMP-(fatty) acid ligase
LGFFAKSAGAKKLRWVLSAGEVLYRSLAEKIMTDAPHVSMANLYGPTETNVVTCQILKTPPTSGPSAVPIGHPCPHVTLTLDGGGNRGEALIDGPSVMLGLVTGPANPPTSPSPRTYATGDILHRDADGALHFLGRNDEQIKLHGNRIELGDIEAAALALPEVSAAAAFVVGSDSDFPKLALCLVTRNGTQDVEKIAEKLASTLPKAAYPKVIVAVNSLPHTSSGKIDKAALRQRIEETKDDNP